ncbi:MAG: fatty acid oxidation complex subunit alpha [Gemmatales bacterium]|nr:MAG: fatty acid oxidation complex subunit alpha [Gemmatales bacterium]
MAFYQSENLHVEVERKIAKCWLDVKGRSHNVFSPAVIKDMEQALDAISAEPGIELVVFLGRKPTGFVAGADIQEFQNVHDADQARQLARMGQELMDRVAQLRPVTVAVIHGPCLGGGLEFALACDYRLVLNQPETQLGLPEIKLGLVPGWGGTQRLPRVVGLEKALRMILEQKTLKAQEAVSWGLADKSFETREDALTWIENELVRHARKRPKTRLPLRSWREFFLESNRVGRWLIFRVVRRMLNRKVPEDMSAPAEAVACVRTGLSAGMAAGLEREREAIARLSQTEACRNLVTLFFLIMNARKSTGSEAVASRTIRKVGVVGAGTMGAGIAQLASVKGCDVVVQEVNEAALAAGKKKIADLLQKAVDKGVLSSDEAHARLQAIHGTTNWNGFDDVDLVIEAVIEDVNLKREVFRTLEQRTRPDTILASNTSSLTIRQLQEGMAQPQRLAGMHFFNPVHKMPLVEVVRGPACEEDAIAALVQFAAKLGKTPVVVGDGPGFVVNRILLPYLSEAGLLLQEGMPVEAIDQTMRRFGMPMGPLELLDQVGLDVAAHIAHAVGPAFADRIPPQPALDRLCELGCLGQKTGKGFYCYQGARKTGVNDQALQTLTRELGIKHAQQKRPRHEQMQFARERMVYLMVNEAAVCLEEGLAERADIIDLAMVLGTGWAPHRGGPLRYADTCGAAEIVRKMEAMAEQLGPRFRPCSELRRRADSGELFYSTLPTLEAVLS